MIIREFRKKNYKRPWWDSNLQSLPPYANALCITPQGRAVFLCKDDFLNTTATRAHYYKLLLLQMSHYTTTNTDDERM